MAEKSIKALRLEVEEKENWREWFHKIPDLHFDREWNVRIYPPFGGAFARFSISNDTKSVSVCLGNPLKSTWMYEDGKPVPYYEVFAKVNGGTDVRKFYLHESDKMMDYIRVSLNGK